MFRSLDVAHAFMHSLYLLRSLNALTNASMHWLTLLWSDEVEPCIYGGQVRIKGNDLGCAMLVAYVDNVLVASEDEAVEKAIEQGIGKAVPVKCPGSVLTGEPGGGSLTFIGRKISRAPNHKQVMLNVDDHYLKTAFHDLFGLGTGLVWRMLLTSLLNVYQVRISLDTDRHLDL